MTARLISAAAISRLVGTFDARRLMRDVLASRSEARGSQLPRFAMGEGLGRVGVMAGIASPDTPGEGTHGVKLVTLAPSSGHAGIMTVFDARTGETRGLLEAGALTALRTAAVSAAVTEAIVGEAKVSKVGILGSGRQAVAHTEAFASLYPEAEIGVFATSPASFERFSSRLASVYRARARHALTPREATRDARVVCTVTCAREPLLDVGDVDPVVHINAVGSCRADHRELTGRLVASSRRFVDSLTSARIEAGDLLLAASEGHIPFSALGIEIGSYLRGESSPPERERTLFKSLGLIDEDLALARLILKRAEEREEGELFLFADES